MSSRKRTDGSAFLRFLYQTAPGRLLLRPLASRGFSRLAGRLMDSRLSRPLIRPFVEKNGIDLSEYLDEPYRCFNDCFCRRIRPENRPVDMRPDILIAPCDGLLSVYDAEGDTVIPAKQSRYTLRDLLRNDALAARFAGGTALVFRLCVDNYHRYAYIDSGIKGENIFLPGLLHTVRPIALRGRPVFCENCREYTVIETDRFGPVVQMEVGAMLVGRICNYDGPGPVRRGGEKGMFLYGGSTVIALLEAGRAEIDSRFWQATAAGRETPVRLGQAIGRAAAPKG